MDNSQNGTEYYSPYLDDGYRLSNTAMILGFIAIGSIIVFPVFITCLCAPLSIVLAYLSKGKNPRMNAKARTGAVVSAASLVITFALVAFSMYFMIRMIQDPVYAAELDALIQRMYGYSLQDILPQEVFSR